MKISIEEFNELEYRYLPIVRSIISSNQRFFKLDKQINWSFMYDDRVALVAHYNNKTKKIIVNIAAVDFAFQKNEPLHIEYFLLHEMRHMYQYTEIEKYKANPEKCNNIEIAKKWSDEEYNYVPPLDKEGNQNDDYFEQDMEMDAVAYAYAVMIYKYGCVEYLCVPKAYKNEKFEKIVNAWVGIFKNENYERSNL